MLRVALGPLNLRGGGGEALSVELELNGAFLGGSCSPCFSGDIEGVSCLSDGDHADQSEKGSLVHSCFSELADSNNIFII